MESSINNLAGMIAMRLRTLCLCSHQLGLRAFVLRHQNPLSSVYLCHILSEVKMDSRDLTGDVTFHASAGLTDVRLLYYIIHLNKFLN